MNVPKRLFLSLAFFAAAARAAEEPPSQQPAPAPVAQEAKPPDTAKHLVYVPESVKQELREEIKKEVLEQAKKENWAAPNLVPSWLSRLKFNGDVRVRWERDLFPPGNANQGEFPDFNAINTNKPFDVNFVDLSGERYLDVDQDRTRPRLRARLGVDAALPQGFSVGLRLASGDSSNPGSGNQTLGTPGDFSKYQVWFDRAFIRYAVDGETRGFSIKLGRFDNPFFNTEMIWSPDVNLDGAVIEASFARDGSFSPFLIGGAFPVYTTQFAFPVEQTSKFLSHNKWLYAAQLGADVKIARVAQLKLGAAFYDFDAVEGRVSSPCDTNLSTLSCDTDETRPAFAQKGNTYIALRTPSATALLLESSSTVARYEFFGLASRFRELVGTFKLGVALAPAVTVEVEGEYVHNAGFNYGQIAGSALNNRGATTADNPIGLYRGGNNGAFGRIGFGSPTQSQRGDWKVRLGYRYVESDAVLDALNDQDFGLGGTNLKGYAIDATIYVADGVALNPRWFSANQIVGPTYAVDVLQIDLMARF
jgi:hypothetical protein